MRSLYYVPSFQAGRIIGRGGSTIRQLKVAERAAMIGMGMP